LIRPLQLASINYSEIVGPWEIRESLGPPPLSRANNDTGLMGVSLAETFLARPGQITRIQVFGLAAIAFLLVIALGVYLANRITQPLLRVVAASAQVAQGNLSVQVDTAGNDEIAVLAYSFNEMVAGLREGNIYRDLLGRTVSPEVREQLRQGFASGDVSLEGQEAIATILISDIHGFTTLSESENPTTIMSWLNEYFEELVPIITDNGGVISKFDGDALLAFFGVLPRPLPAQESACQACQTALAMLEAIERLNTRRVRRGEPSLGAGIGINTGPVTAGALGAADRLHYTIIGDTVNTTTRLEDLTRQFGEENSAVISQHTLFALRERRHEFELEAMGTHNVKGKIEQLLVYQLKPAKIAAGR
jgi:adenylate cyclase